MNCSFAITGFGRSGTKWLAELMNRSAVWTVLHEPSGAYDRRELCQRFSEGISRGAYAESNSFLLPSLWDLPVQKRGVLIRDPLAIAVSAANRGHQMTDGFVSHLACCLALIDSALGRGAIPIPFHAMTTDLGYLSALLHSFGIDDVNPTEADLATKINSAGRETIGRWEDFDVDTRRRIECACRWYRNAYEIYGAKRIVA